MILSELDTIDSSITEISLSSSLLFKFNGDVIIRSLDVGDGVNCDFGEIIIFKSFNDSIIGQSAMNGQSDSFSLSVNSVSVDSVSVESS